MNFRYNPTIWSNRITQNPTKYRIKNGSGDIITLEPVHGIVIERGTPINYANMTKIDNAITEIYNNINNLKGDISSQTVNIMNLNFELRMIKKSNLVGSSNQMVVFDLNNSDDINLLKGIYDSDNNRITI